MVCVQALFFSRPSRLVCLALRARLALALPRLKNAKKMTPVLQATIKVNSHWMLSELTIKATVSPAESDSDDDDIM